jgi:hypothetical protein
MTLALVGLLTANQPQPTDAAFDLLGGFVDELTDAASEQLDKLCKRKTPPHTTHTCRLLLLIGGVVCARGVYA